MCGGGEAVLASTRFKLVTGSIEMDASEDGQELTMRICESGYETTVNLTQSDSRATVKFFRVEKLSHRSVVGV